MKLYEHEGKFLFNRESIPIPRGKLALTLSEALQTAEVIGYPVVIKSQVLRGRRGAEGGIKFATSSDELTVIFSEFFQQKISEHSIAGVLIEAQLKIRQELYAGIVLDPNASLPLLMITAEGGTNIEETAMKHPEKLVRLHLYPNNLPEMHILIKILLNIGIIGTPLPKVASAIYKLILCFFKYNCLTAEINPLVIDEDDNVFAADSKVELDDAALKRMDIIQYFHRNPEDMDPYVKRANAINLSYVRLKTGGNIGLITGGAGLGMATMDMIDAHGGKPANFLDLGGGIVLGKSAEALRIVLETPGVEGVLINVFGGINNCEQIAKGICMVFDEDKPSRTIVVKMRGHSQEEGWRLLEERNIPIIKKGTTEEAVILLLDKMNGKV